MLSVPKAPTLELRANDLRSCTLLTKSTALHLSVTTLLDWRWKQTQRACTSVQPYANPLSLWSARLHPELTFALVLGDKGTPFFLSSGALHSILVQFLHAFRTPFTGLCVLWESGFEVCIDVVV